MQFRKDADVVTAAGRKVGELRMLVVEPKTLDVTHLVINKGFLLKSGKVLPVERVAEATEDGIRLKQETDDMDNLPDFEETHLVTIEEADQSDSGYAPSITRYHRRPGIPWWGFPGYSGAPPYIAETKTNIPEHSAVLPEGSEVVTKDGKRIGEVEEVYTEPEENRVTHILISKGIFSKKKKLIPSSWIGSVEKDEVRLVVFSDLIERLPFESESELGE